MSISTYGYQKNTSFGHHMDFVEPIGPKQWCGRFYMLSSFGFLFTETEVYSISSYKAMGNCPEVLNLNRLFVNLNRFSTVAAGSPGSFGRKRGRNSSSSNYNHRCIHPYVGCLCHRSYISQELGFRDHFAPSLPSLWSCPSFWIWMHCSL